MEQKGLDLKISQSRTKKLKGQRVLNQNQGGLTKGKEAETIRINVS
jgi:hypothetical protein